MLGYEREKHIRLYGEKICLLSNPFPDGEGFAIEGLTHELELKRIHIPLPIVRTLQREMAVEKLPEVAA